MSIKATTQREHYKTLVQSKNHSIIADEPIDLGGQDLGMNPAELVCASLATCTSITLRMYIDRKEWNVDTIEVDVTLNEDKDNPSFTRIVTVKGQLADDQVSRLLSIANACPMHKLLSRGTEINTTINYQSNN
jgi:putative redox protein